MPLYPKQTIIYSCYCLHFLLPKHSLQYNSAVFIWLNQNRLRVTLYSRLVHEEAEREEFNRFTDAFSLLQQLNLVWE